VRKVAEREPSLANLSDLKQVAIGTDNKHAFSTAAAIVSVHAQAQQMAGDGIKPLIERFDRKRAVDFIR
jgi:hypothetical protein